MNDQIELFLIKVNQWLTGNLVLRLYKIWKIVAKKDRASKKLKKKLIILFKIVSFLI
jgi:hypothetical protein